MNVTGLSRRITLFAVGASVVMLSALLVFGWWAASRIDGDATQRQARSIAIGLDEVAERTQIEQDSSAIWDDAVANVRASNDAWIAENLAEWVSEYYGHDRVYLCASADKDGYYLARGWEAIERDVGDHRLTVFVKPTGASAG